MRNRASGTAILVALGMLTLGHRRPSRRGELVSAQERTLLRHTLRQMGGLPAVLSSRACIACAGVMERLFVPRIITHFGIRKVMIERAARRAIGEGFAQVVVIGAGLDLLTLRLALSGANARLIEIDHPATQASKRRMLALAAIEAHSIELISADLATTTVADSLARAARFDPALPTIFVVEGLTMYLTGPQVRTLLKNLRQSAPASRLLVTFMEPNAAGRVRFARETPLLRLLLRLIGEPFQWGVAKAELPSFLRSEGWTLLHLSGPPEFAACADSAGIHLAERECVGEHLAQASPNEM
jgi:methyltransferase (TIGR00027 family)